MGTHVNGPAEIAPKDAQSEESLESLESFLKTKLPYLFKVLSVDRALSIQAHPDLALARRLHADYPDRYKDANHKPEMAVALSEFEALVQFRALEELAVILPMVPELRMVLRDTPVVLDNFQSNPSKVMLTQVFSALMNAPQEHVVEATLALSLRLASASTADSDKLSALVRRLLGQYPHDIGVFAPYFLNVVTLAPGEAVYLGANEPHAYLSGDCIECMASSDNVVRAGLTPKFIDKRTLVDMLTYATGPPDILTGRVITSNHRMYTPPVTDFEIDAFFVCSKNDVVDFPACDSASIFIVISGQGTFWTDICPEERHSWGRGEVVLQLPHTIVYCQIEHDDASCPEDLVVYRAHSQKGHNNGSGC